jgi:hypothetical protein
MADLEGVGECPFCFTNVLFNPDGTCPNCKKKFQDALAPEKVKLDRMQHDRDTRARRMNDLEINFRAYKGKFVRERILPSVLLCLLGLIFSFFIETGFIWVGAIVSGIVYFFYGLINYFYSVKDVRREMEDIKRKIEKSTGG